MSSIQVKGFKRNGVSRLAYTALKRKAASWTPEEAKDRVIDARRPHCPFCDSVAEIKTSQEFYGKDYDCCVWYCPKCTDVYVGTQKGSNKALGKMANKETRKFRKITHEELDYKFKNGSLKKNDLYTWISDKLDLSTEDAHIGNFSIDECKEIIKVARKEQFDLIYGHLFGR